MQNKQIQFLLNLKDELSAKWRTVTDKVVEGAKNMVRQFERHWQSITAGYLAVRSAVSKAMDMAESYNKHAQSLSAFGGMVRKAGLDVTEEFDKIRKASGGLIDDKALVESANRAMSLGIPIQNLAGFLEIARAKARDMGTTTKDAFNDLVVALGRQSAPILDNLGIIVKTEAANEAYAKSLGKTVSQLTDAEKKQAFMNAALDAGREALTRQNLELTTFNEKIQRMRALITNTELFVGQIITRIAVFIVGVMQSAAVGMLEIWQKVIAFFAALEGRARLMGLTTSTYFAESYASVTKAVQDMRGEAVTSFETAFLAAEKFAEVVGGGSSNSVAGSYAAADAAGTASVAATVQNESKKLAAVQNTIGKMKLAHESYTKVVKLQGVEQVDAVRGLTAQMEEDLTQRMQSIQMVMSGMLMTLQDTFTSLFNGEIAEGVKGFLKGIVLILIDTVQAFVMAAAAAAWAKGVLTFGFSTFADLPMVAAATVGLQLLRALVAAKFHDGGIVPKPGGGSYISAPASREFPILVRGGETIRTEAQEAEVQGALASRGSVVNIHINGPIATAQAFKDIVERGMRETGITDVGQYFRNSRSNLVLAV